MWSSMEQMVNEFKKLIPLKETTTPGDVVIILGRNPEMVAYALVTGIERDPNRRDEWWHVRLYLLGVPPQDMTWTLRTPQMTGQEIFTMGGVERFVKALAIPADVPPRQVGKPANNQGKSAGLRVVK